MDNKKPRRYGPRSYGPFPDIDDSDPELEQGDEEAGVGNVLAEAPILPFSETLVRDLLLNLSQENGRRLAEVICADYGYSISTADIHGCLDVDFFQEHAVRNGYLLTPNFLALINELRTIFSDHMDVLFSLYDFDSFLSVIDGNNLSPSYLSALMGTYSLNFSNSASLVRSRLVDFLRSTIIPALVEIINQNTILRGHSECRLGYSDREQLLLHISTVFERLIILRMMNYWNDFCSVNQALLSLLPGTDYSNPFIVARDNCGFIIPDVSSPAAFTTVHGIYLSFMAVNYLDNIIENTVLTVIDLLRPVISDPIFLKELRESGNRALSPIIHREFSRFVDSHVGPEITRFLNETLIWS
ncbi:hypothetical protein, partial [Candidatus Ichthyocystis hellenicum]|uniref:hypothetical protein n=1 Tax=Candidatus Ichthyocystis hellenicum TaxID=1561003 RepID=UPI0011121A62